MGDWTGTVPTFVVGKLSADDMDTMADIATASTAAWTTWSPTYSSITVGNGTVVAKYRRVGKTVDYKYSLTLGSTSAIGTTPVFSLPATPAADYGANIPVGGGTVYLDSGTGRWEGSAFALSGANATCVYSTEAGGGSGTTITATAPFTWTTGDVFAMNGTFETT